VKTGELVSRKYRLTRRIAEGGMGEVWSARNERTNRDFAIKFLLPELTREPEALHRFVREAKATGSLRHPNVVTAIDAGMYDERPYLVMELLVGESLDARLQREGRMDELETCIMLSQVARALQHAHQKGLIHRDLSSANVYLCNTDDDGPPLTKVLDFGVSKVLGDVPNGRVRTGGGKILGSPQYMSPEQAQGAEGVDARTDIWSFGVLAYQCLSGKLPFEGLNYNALLFAILHAPHEPLLTRIPQLDPELCELIEGCLVKDREVRTASIGLLAQQLEQLALRLAREHEHSQYLPLRRRGDRLRITSAGDQARWLARRALPRRTLSPVTRLAQHLQTVPRSITLAFGLLIGAGVGLVGAKALLPQPPQGISAAPLPKSVCERRELDSREESFNGEASVRTNAAMATSSETDLVKAMARGLQVGSRGKSRAPVAPGETP
jgi:serine/threonine-protein kinase